MNTIVFFFFKQKTAYEMRISDWSSDVCSSDLYGDEQLMTTDMPASVPGDSGGPVWLVDDNGQAHIIGIWLGDKAAPASGHRYGRFARSEERRVGKECVSTCRYWGSQDH